jgi:taurine dioxygenase
MLIRELSPLGGVEVEGFDLADPDPAGLRSARELFEEHGLVVFRGQSLTKRQLVAAGDLFGGSIRDIPGAAADPDEAGIIVVSTRGPDGGKPPGDEDAIVGFIDWHSDQGYVTRPNRAKILYALQVPPEGGLTGFIDGESAWRELPTETRERVEGLHVIHSYDFAQAAIAHNRAYRLDGEKALSEGKYPDIAFPVACAHPRRGALSLHVPPLWCSGIVELPGEEGARMLAGLQRHMLRPERQYWHRYRIGDAVLWDNWRYLHAAGGTPGKHARTLWSVSLSGQGPAGRALPRTLSGAA